MAKRVIQGLAAFTAVGVAEKTAQVRLVRAGVLVGVRAEIASGTGATMTVSVYDKASSPGVVNTVWTKAIAATTGIEEMQAHYKNVDDKDELTVGVSVNAGADSVVNIHVLVDEAETV